MFEVGTVCVKTAGRDAGKTCVVVEKLENGFVLIDGATRRRKCNTLHLEPTGKVSVKQGADHAAVMKALGLEPRKSAPRKAAAKPSKAKPVKTAPAKKAAKSAAKKAAAKKAEAPAKE